MSCDNANRYEIHDQTARVDHSLLNCVSRVPGILVNLARYELLCGHVVDHQIPRKKPSERVDITTL